ncbi:type II secretion system F family protein [Candidatus Giovannonibacteria bacterium]|nr:type II secretion system F family protein [Candidatus Giovannonibacteria bacterium]
MAVYSYLAKNLEGEERKGSKEAKDKYDLSKSLREEGFTLISAETEGSKKISISIPIFSRISVAEKMLFARNLSVMISAGLALSRSIEILSEETKNQRFKKTLLNVAASVSKGSNFSESLRNFPKIFSKLFVAMVSAGEKTGNMDGSLKLISHQLKREYDLRRKVRGAMIYPVVILIAMFIVGILMMIFIVPTLVSTFQELNMELPTLTKVVIFISNFLIHNLVIALLGFFIVIFSIYSAFQTERGKKILDAVLLKIPVISRLVKQNNAARTSRTLGSLIGSGVAILEALDITGDVIQNHYFKEVIKEAREKVEKGGAVSSAFVENAGLYPSLVGEMMAIGEETGKLSEMLFRLAVFYEGEVGQATKDMSTIIEPVLMIIIGAVVGLFALSMIQPLYGIVGNF